MNASINAVFLSYASQDVAAARRIDEALRAAGVVVWFDESELRGGDAWDASIRKKIKECALFVPIISANTESRSEGYFRLEWKLAVDRSHLMADDQPFLLPVVNANGHGCRPGRMQTSSPSTLAVSWGAVKRCLQRLRPPRCEPRQQRSPASRASSKGSSPRSPP
jgi:hypothetical protein